MICRPLAGLGDHLRQPDLSRPAMAPCIRLEGLTGHVMIGFVSSRTQRTLPLELYPGDGRPERGQFAPSAADFRCRRRRRSGRLGFGLYQAPLPRLEADLASGALTEVLADFRPAPLPLSCSIQ